MEASDPNRNLIGGTSVVTVRAPFGYSVQVKQPQGDAEKNLPSGGSGTFCTRSIALDLRSSRTSPRDNLRLNCQAYITASI